MKTVSIALVSMLGLVACTGEDHDAYRTYQDGAPAPTVLDARPPTPPQDGGGTTGGDAMPGPSAALVTQWMTGTTPVVTTVQSTDVNEDGEVVIPHTLGPGTTLYFRVPLPDSTTFPAQVRIPPQGQAYYRIDEANTVYPLPAANVGAYITAPISSDFCADTPVVMDGNVFVNTLAAPVKVGLSINLFSAKWCPFKLANCAGKSCDRTFFGQTLPASCHLMNLGWLGQQCICAYD
jgi:hypothetical protein